MNTTSSSSSKYPSSGPSSTPTSAPSSNLSTFFVRGAGIDVEVISCDICQLLGNDALVKPGTHIDKNGQTQEGYYITAYRAPTSAQLNDLREDTRKYLEEKRNNPSATYSYEMFDEVRTLQENWEVWNPSSWSGTADVQDTLMTDV